MDAIAVARWRRMVEGDPIEGTRRRLDRIGAELVVVDPQA